MDDLLLRLSNGTRLYSPATLNSITTYVLLEQETWFEKEFAFIERLLQPGMHAVDIGANLGTYSLAMAKAVGPRGRVSAYEPTSATRARLERSCAANGASQIEVLPYALSDGARTGRIVFENSSELNHLGSDGEGEGESVEITSLDLDAARFGWSDPYFIKIDAEGEEIPILKGGAELLREHSPLLMLELRSTTDVNRGLIAAVEAIGYRAYRLFGRERFLVPFDAADIDGMELNFFAAKDDRAAELEARGLLVRSIADTPAAMRDEQAALANLRGQSFAPAFQAQFAPDLEVNSSYRQSLAAYHIWRDARHGLAERLAALRDGYSTLRQLCNEDGRIGRLTTLARMANDVGQRGFATKLLKIVIDEVAKGRLSLGEPFWPGAERFETVPVGGRPVQWYMAAVCEHAEISQAHSSIFSAPPSNLPWLCNSGFASVEMFRRRTLRALRNGEAMSIPEVLLEDSAQHLNAHLWRDGTVAALSRLTEREAMPAS